MKKQINIGSCCEVAEKKKGFVYCYEVCGNRAKIEIEYAFNNKQFKKKLCMRHYKSVTTWLNKINVPYRDL